MNVMEDMIPKTEICPYCGEQISISLTGVEGYVLREYPAHCCRGSNHHNNGCSKTHEQWTLFKSAFNCGSCGNTLLFRCVYVQPCNQDGYIHDMELQGLNVTSTEHGILKISVFPRR